MEAIFSFGEWVRERRQTLDLTRPELAHCVGCSVSALRKIEADERRPSRQLAELLAGCLALGPDQQPAFVEAARGRQRVDRLKTPQLVSPSLHANPQPAVPVSNLPAPATPLIGRESELKMLGQLLADPGCRLLTLVGPGGIGKTRLALEAACEQWDAFAGNVYLASLAATTSPEFMLPAIAQAAGLTLSGSADPQAQLVHFLHNREVLIVLDNLEHLLAGVELIVKILEQAPRLKVLATSRERLEVLGEWAFDVQGLPVPPETAVDALEQYSSAQLFLQRAHQASTAFELAPEDRPHLAHICRLVEGVPLALELAATWVTVLSCAEIAAEIGRSLDFLSTTSRDLPERQRSLRATFDYSWTLLPAEERLVLGRLSLFCCGFQREAADTVAGANLRVLLALVSKSFLRRTARGRFTMHELVRQYARSRFEESGEEDRAARDRHSEFFLALLCRREAALKSAAQQETIQELVEEIDNLLAAWAWAAERKNFGLLGPALRCFGLLCDISGWSREGIGQIELLLRALRSQPPSEERQKVLGQALTQKGLLYFRLGEHLLAQSFLEESLAILRPLGEPALLVDPLVLAGIILHLTGDLARARSFLAEGLETAQAAGDRWYAAYALFNQGYIDGLDGRGEEGYRKMTEGIALWRALGDPRFTALGLNFISPLAISLGRVEEAKGYLQESLALSTKVGDRWGIGTAYRHLGVAAIAEGHYAEARTLLGRSLDTFQGFVTGWDVARSLLYLGEAVAAAGDSGEARAQLIHALDLAVKAGALPLALEATIGLAELCAGQGDVEQALVLAGFVLGHPASIRETLGRAERLRAHLEPQLAPARRAKLKANGQHLSLDAVVERAHAYPSS